MLDAKAFQAGAANLFSIFRGLSVVIDPISFTLGLLVLFLDTLLAGNVTIEVMYRRLRELYLVQATKNGALYSVFHIDKLTVIITITVNLSSSFDKFHGLV